MEELQLQEIQESLDTFQGLTGMDEDAEEVADELLESEALHQEASPDGAYLVEVTNFEDFPLADPVDLAPVVDSIQAGFLFLSFLIAAILAYLISRDIVGGLIR